MIKVFTDGGSRGNPGPAALGVFIADEKGNEIKSIGKTLGHATNNVAEYSAVVEALTWLSKNPQGEEIAFSMDSELVCRQLNGIYRVKNAQLAKLLIEIRNLERKIPVKITYSHIPRELNKKADALVNLALDTA